MRKSHMDKIWKTLLALGAIAGLGVLIHAGRFLFARFRAMKADEKKFDFLTEAMRRYDEASHPAAPAGAAAGHILDARVAVDRAIKRWS
jgi:hypothetical protein